MSEQHFFILHQAAEVSVYSLNNDVIKPIRFKGEPTQAYTTDDAPLCRRFWNDFKQKITPNQPLNLLVASDTEPFELPEELVLSERYDRENPTLSRLASQLDLSQLTLLTYPNCEDFELPTNIGSTVLAEEIIAEEPSSTKTPRDFFIKKTRSYRSS